MDNNTLMSLFLFYIIILASHSRTSAAAAAAAASDPPVELPSPACSDKLVTFSTCLPYVAVSPNNLTDSPTPQCCDDVSSAFGDGSAICLCYFVLQPKILGFPLDSSRLLSLTSVCQLRNRDPKSNFSLQTLCSESAALPPLQSTTGSGDSKPRNIGAKSPPPPSMGSAQELSDSPATDEPADKLPSQPSLSKFPTTISSATERIYVLGWTLLCFSAYILTSV